ncbi:MAG: thioredoxin [Chloroflexi bacterium]|nr:thioredoxin [Chloroflexota bacterium]
MANLIGFEAPTPPPADLIKEATEATFVADVIETSRQVPVIVDFWATWCEPCKQLTPILEKVVTEARGAVRLVKVDIDKNPTIAQQLRIQSVPMVFAFHDGRPVDGFNGAQSESQVKTFVDKLVKTAGGTPMGRLIRRYWVPALLSAEVAQAEAKVEDALGQVAYYRGRYWSPLAEDFADWPVAELKSVSDQFYQLVLDKKYGPLRKQLGLGGP